MRRHLMDRYSYVYVCLLLLVLCNPLVCIALNTFPEINITHNTDSREPSLKEKFDQFIKMFESDDEDIYTKILLGNELWNHRKELSDFDFEILCMRLKKLYSDAKRVNDELKVCIAYFRLKEIRGDKDCYHLHGDLANVYYKLNEFENAEKHYLILAEFQMKNGNPFGRASTYNNLGELHLKFGKKRSATDYFNRALNLLEDPKNLSSSKQYTSSEYFSYFKCILRWNILEAQESPSVSPGKDKLAKQIIHTGKIKEEYFWVTTGYTYLAERSYASQDYDLAIQYLDSALISTKNYGITERYIELLNRKAQTLLAAGLLSKGEQLFVEAKKMSDSMDRSNSSARATVAAAFYEAKEKEEELAEKKMEILVAKNEADTEKRTNVVLTIVAFLITAILIILFTFYRKTRRDKQKIEEQSKALQKSLTDKEFLMQEIHHRVKNNMQIMSGLFELQSLHTENEAFKNLARESRNRIESLALVHQMLYSNSDLNEVDFNEYTEALVQQICFSLDTKRQIDFSFEMDKVCFDANTTISLGLIINELVTNSMKYAFTDSGGRLKITLKDLGTNDYQLCVEDDGNGVENLESITKSESLGLKLVKLLSDEIRATVDFRSESGFACTLKFHNNYSIA